MKKLFATQLIATAISVFALGAEAVTYTTKIINWSLPENWEAGVTYDVREVKIGGQGQESCVDIFGGELARRYGLGAVGEPDLPTMTINVGIPSGGSFVSATLGDVEWEEVKGEKIGGGEGVGEGRKFIPIPIAEPVQYGAELIYPTPEAGAYGGVYPSTFVIAGNPGISGGVTMVPLTITPYKWDGTTKTLYKAAAMTVKVELKVKKTLRLSTSSTSSAKTNPNSAKGRAMARTINPDDLASSGGLKLSTSSATATTDNLGQIIIITPCDFVKHWQGYAAYRKSTAAGANFEYIIKNTMDIYTNSTYWTKHCSNPLNFVRQDSVDALAIHHYIESVYNANKEQYIILGAAPAKYGYDRACMIPARYVVNQNSYDQVCDMYYGFLDRYDSSGNNIGKAAVDEDSPEVWDYDCDGYYMGKKNAGGGYTSDNNKYVDWEMDIPVTRVPMMREYVEYSNGEHKLTADDIMDHFTNNIEFAESSETWTSAKSWRQVLGGGYLFNSYTRGSTDSLVRDEHTFFDGGINFFHKDHSSPAPDAEACPRKRQFDTFAYYRASRHSPINTGGLVTMAWADLYKNFGDCFNVHCHGWARGADPGTTGGALFATGLWRVFNMALPCESGMYDYYSKYNGVYQGYTNCCSMGEAPLLCFNQHAGGLVTFNNSRYGWWGGYNGMSSHMDGLVSRAFYEKELNAGQACLWIHNTCTLKTTGSRGGACNLEVIMHGDPLIKISPQYDRTWSSSTSQLAWTTNTTTGAGWIIDGKEGDQPFDYTKNMFVDATGKGDITFDIVDDDLGAARLKMAGDAGKTITLGGAGKFRTTDSLVVTNASLKWNAAGGAGRNGIEFVGSNCDLTFEGNAERYIGYKVKNVRNLNVSGFNVTFDSDHGASAANDFTVQHFSFIGTNILENADGDYNVIRSRNPAFFSDSMTIPVVSNRVELQTYNIGGSTASYAEKPLFFLTNAYLKVTYNPYWQAEYFIRPTHLTDSHIVGEYASFGFGIANGSTGYDIYVWGKSSIEGETPICVNGELRIHLMDESAELEIANPMKNGPYATGSLRIMGAGKVRITATQTFTGGVTVEGGASLELGIANAVSCDVTVLESATLTLDAIPLESVQTLTVNGGATLVLPGPTGAGIYQIIDSATSKLVLSDTAKVYDAKNLGVELGGMTSEGYFLLTDNLIYWQRGEGVWKNDASVTDYWHDKGNNAVGFTNTMPVVFGDVGGAASVAVALDGDVQPGYVDFSCPNSVYTFAGKDGTVPTISLESLASSYDVNFGVNLAVNNVLKSLGGLMTATNVTASLIEVATNGALHVTGEVRVPTKKVKALKFSFSATQNSGNVAAVQELRLFQGDTFFPLPTGTVIEDIAGQKIEITGHTSYTHQYKWLANQPSNENESLKALIDCILGDNNKWWASNKSAPTWFTITFPSEQDVVTGYALRTADHAPRNPKAWSVYTSTDGENFVLAASVDSYTFSGTQTWMGSGGGTKPDFSLQSVDGTMTVRDGGTLYADGEIYINLVFEAGSTLSVTNSCILEKKVGAASLTLPSAEGSIKVDASLADATSTAFPILKGFDLTAADFLKFTCVNDNAVLNLKGGDLYIVTDGIKASPYTAMMTETSGSASWSELSWQDGNGENFTWDANVNYRTDGEAAIYVDWVDGVATTINLDIGGALGKLTVADAPQRTSAYPITLKWGSVMVPRTLVFSNYTGAVTMDYSASTDYQLGYSDFVAGHDTTIPVASSGSLYIGEGMRAIAPGWGDLTKVTGAGTFAYNAATKDTAVDALWAKNIGVSGTVELLRGTWTVNIAASSSGQQYPLNKEVKIGANGVLKLTTKNDTTGYGTYSTGLTIADGGELQVACRDTFNRRMTLHNGGKLTFTQDASDSNRVFDFYNNAEVYVTGSESAFIGGSAASNDSETGDPIVKSGIIALRRPSDFTVDVAESSTLNVYAQWGGAAGTTYPWIKSGAGRMSFYRSSDQTGSMTISAGAVRLVNKGQGTTGIIVNQSELQLEATKNSYTQTVANVIQGTGTLRKLGEGTTILSGVNTYSGLTTVEAGTLKIGNADALGASSVWMAGGTLDLGDLRIPDYTVNSAYGTDFKIRANLTQSQLSGQVQLVKLGNFADDMTSGELKGLFEFYVDGVKQPSENYKIVVTGGIAEYQPDQLTGYNFPLETTVATSNDWTKFAWHDQSNVAFTNDWSEYSDIAVIINVEDGAKGQMTFEKNRSNVTRLTINNQGGQLEIGGGAGTFVTGASGMVDATGSTEGSVTFLNFDLGKWNIDTGAGEVILLAGCSGTLNTDVGSTVTITNGTGRGTAVLVEGSELRFLGTTAMSELLWCSVDNRTGAWIGYGFPITSDEIAFGGVGDSPSATYGNFHFQGNLQMVTKRFVAGNGKGSVENFKQSGGSIEITGSGNGSTTTDSSILLAHWPSTITWTQSGGTFTATNAPTVFGWDGKIDWTMTGGTTRLKGLAASRVSSHDNTSSFTLAGGRLEIGDLGIAFTNRSSYNASFTFAGGTLEAYTSATMAVEKGITVTSDSTISAVEGATLIVDAAISGAGTLNVAGEGTVRFTGDCSNAKLAGKFQIAITEAQRTGSTSTPLFIVPDGVTEPQVTIVGEDGTSASGGNWRIADGKCHWVPSGKYIQPMTTTLSGGTVNLASTTWTDAGGASIAYTALTSDMELVFNVTADTTLNINDAKSAGTVRFTGDGTVTLSNTQTFIYSLTVAQAEICGKVTALTAGVTLAKITALDEDAVLTVNSADRITAFGDGPFYGTLICNNFDPNANWTIFQTASKWQGTVKVTAAKTLDSNTALGNYGTSSSTLDIAGTWNGYFPKAGTADVNLKVSDTLKFSNGYSSDGGFIFTGALSGTGKIETTTNPSGNAVRDVIAFTGDASHFFGTVTQAGGHCVAFGTQADDDTCANMIVIASTTPVIASNKTWSATSKILVKDGGVLSVQYRNGAEYAASSAVEVSSGGTLNLVRDDDAQVEFKITSGTLTLTGGLTLNGVQVPSWGYTQDGGTITLKDKAVCKLPVKATVSGAKNLSALTFTDSATTPNTFSISELNQVDDLEVDFTCENDAVLTLNEDLGASIFKFDGAVSVIGDPGATTIYASEDTTLDTTGTGTLIIESGKRATVPAWDKDAVSLSSGGTLALTDGGTRWPSYNAVSGAMVDLTHGDFTLDCNGASGGQLPIGAKLRISGDAQVSIVNGENGIKPGSTLEIAGGATTLDARFLLSQGGIGEASVVRMTGGTFSTVDNSNGHIYIVNNGGKFLLDISGGRFTANYAPYSGSDAQGVKKCYGTTIVTDEGVFAPGIISMSDATKVATTVADVTVTSYNHNLYLADGGTYLAPAISPNWYAISVTNGTGNIGAQSTTLNTQPSTLIKGPITVDAGCVLNVTNGTVKLNSAIQGEGTVNVSEGATLDLNGNSVYNVTGGGTITNSSDTAAYVIYNSNFETNLTFNCGVKIQNCYVNVSTYSQTIPLIVKGTGTIAEMNGVRVKVAGVINRNTWHLTTDAKGIVASEPYHANLTNTTNWEGGKGAGLTDHNEFLNDSNYSILITNLSANATLTFDTATIAAGLRIVSSASTLLHLYTDDTSLLTLGSYDFSEALGVVSLDFNPGSVSVTAGADSRFTAGGDGTLTIPSGAKATVNAAFGGYANEGTLRRDYACGSQDYTSFIQGGTSATNSFKSVTLTGSMQTAKAVIQVLDGDTVTLKGSNGSRTKASFDLQGGKLTFDVNGEANTWYGENGVTTFRQSGGIFEATANSQTQNGNVGFMIGYMNTSASDISFDISGGHFLVANTSISFYDPSFITLRGTGLMRAKGVFKPKSYATMTMSESARFELGSLGWREGSAALTMNGGVFSTFQDATMENAITLGGPATIGAAAGTTLTLNADVTGAYPLTIGNVASNDTGTVVADGSHFKCGAISIVAGTLSVPCGTLTNDVTLSGSAKLDITEPLGGLQEYTITSGKLTGADSNNVTFNGQSLAEAKLELNADTGKLVSTVATQPFYLNLTTDYTGMWTNANWVGANNRKVTPDQWDYFTAGAVCQAFVTVDVGVTDRLVSDYIVMVDQLFVTNSGTLTMTATPDSYLAVYEFIDDSASTGTTTLNGSFAQIIAGANTQVEEYDGSIATITDGKKLSLTTVPKNAITDTCFTNFTGGTLNIACGTLEKPLEIKTSTKNALDSKNITIASGSALKLHELSSGSGNRIWTIAGDSAATSTLILATERGLGFDGGSNFTNLTLVVDAATTGKKTYLEQRNANELITDASVDVVITNDSILVVDGSSSYKTTVNIGNLSGNGTIARGYGTGTLGVNLHSDSTYDGVSSIPMVVSGNHTLTLTGANTGLVTANAGATVKFAGSGTITTPFAGEGTFELASGTLNVSTTQSANLKVDEGATLNVIWDPTDSDYEHQITTGSLTAADGTVTLNGEKLPSCWAVTDGKLSRTNASQPFTLNLTESGSYTGSTADWRGTNDKSVSVEQWTASPSAKIIVSEGVTATLDADHVATIATLAISNAGTLTVSSSAESFNVTTLDDSSSVGKTTFSVGLGSATITAGKDLVLNVAGTGSVTVDAGMKVTVPNWPDDKISGAGTVVYQAAQKSDAVTWGRHAVFTGDWILQRGTWTISTGNNGVSFPNVSSVTAEGSDAKIAFTTKIDASGYDLGLSNVLTIKDGAELNVAIRDTFSRPLVLDNGGRVTFPEDATNGGRAIDIYKNASIRATGTATNVIGGVTAGTTEGSGIILVRKEPTITVEAGATLDIWSQWGYDAESSLGNKTVFDGAGTLIFRRASPMTGSFTVNAGRLVLLGEGTPTTGEIVLGNGAVLDIERDKTISNTVTLGEGARLALNTAEESLVQIDLPVGTLNLPSSGDVANYFTLNGKSLPSGKWVIRNGKLINSSRIRRGIRVLFD